METNQMTLEFESISANESFARVAVAAFASQLDPTLEEIEDIKTAVSEAVTNSIIHGYEKKNGTVRLEAKLDFLRSELSLIITDWGCGIENVPQAREPLFTTKPESDRSGMGFVFMEVFMDSLEVESKPNQGTVVRMRKIINRQSEK